MSRTTSALKKTLAGAAASVALVAGGVAVAAPAQAGPIKSAFVTVTGPDTCYAATTAKVAQLTWQRQVVDVKYWCKKVKMPLSGGGHYYKYSSYITYHDGKGHS